MSSCNVLLIPGWGFDSSIWKTCEALLRQRHEISRTDILDSDDGLISDAIRQSLKPNSILIGWSLGANLAVDLAIDNSAVSGLLLLNYNPCFCQINEWPHAIPADRLQQMKRDLQRDREQCLKQFYRWCSLGNRQSQRWFKSTDPALVSSADNKRLINGLDHLLQVDQRRQLAAMQCRVLMLFAEQDTLVPTAAASDCAELNPEIVIETIAGASHISLLLEPTPIMNGLGRLLQQVA